MDELPILLIALIAAAIIMFFSWLNSKAYRRRLSASEAMQEKHMTEVKEMSERHNQSLVNELKAIRTLLEKRP